MTNSLPPNPVLRRLGFADDDRVVVLHADDIGMCQASITAWQRALDFGLLSSAATMVPCPWFHGTAQLCRERAGDSRLDMGVHLTLTSEWKNYRWGPIRSRNPATGLLDGDGLFHRLAEPVAAQAYLPAMADELRAQIDRALEQGIDVTHIDTHMLTLFHPRLLPVYARLGFEYGLPVFLLRSMASNMEEAGIPPGQAEEATQALAEAEARGFPLFDHLEVLSLSDAEDRHGEGMRAINAAPPGLTNLLCHMSVDTPELRAIAPDWRCRVGDADIFTSDAFAHDVAKSGVKVINFRILRDLVRSDQ